MLESPVKYPLIAVHCPGSRIGQADVLWAMCECELQKGNHSQASKFIADSLRMYQEERSPLGVAQAKHLRAQIRSMGGNLVQTFKDYNDCIHTYRDWNALARLADALIGRAEAALASTSLSRAREDLHEARRLHIFRHDVAGEALTWKMEAEINMATGERTQAQELLTFAYERASQVNLSFVMAEALRLQGEIAAVNIVLGEHHPRYKVAIHYLKQALPIYESLGYRLGEANTRRALAAVYRKTKHWHHHESNLRHALEAYQKINHRLGIALVKADLARLAGLRSKTEEAAELLEDAMPALEELEQRYQVAEKSGVMVTEGNRFHADIKGQDLMVEWDPFWQARLSKINYAAAGAGNPADLVRSVLKNHSLSIENAGLEIRAERVGVTGDELLDLPQTWMEGVGWFFSDDAEVKAFDEIHWLNMDQQGNKEKMKSAKRGRHHLERLLAHLGISAQAGDDEIKDKAARTFAFFDDDGSGKLRYACQ